MLIIDTIDSQLPENEKQNPNDLTQITENANEHNSETEPSDMMEFEDLDKEEDGNVDHELT